MPLRINSSRWKSGRRDCKGRRQKADGSKPPGRSFELRGTKAGSVCLLLSAHCLLPSASCLLPDAQNASLYASDGSRNRQACLDGERFTDRSNRLIIAAPRSTQTFDAAARE
jgi:hypothetical protein